MRFWIACLLAPSLAVGASFDCTRAATPVERLICTDTALSTLDEHLGRYYAAATVFVKEAQACLRADQQAWLQKRNRCRDEGCLKALYLDRLAELDGMQPGATAIKETILPRRAALVWIIPPAADKVAAPPNPRAAPGEFSGAIIDEVATGDGFVVRAPSGERRLLVPAMFLEGATQAQLSAFASEKAATFVVRGHMAVDGGRKYFEPGACTFIHRAVAVAAAEGRIFADPAQQHPGFKPHQLAFATPKDGVARTEFRSAPFQAVILKSAPRCTIGEAERLEVQKLFPSNKVFTTRFGCEDDVEEHVTYTNADPKWGFLAVHAGATEAEAREFLRKVNALGRFPGANVRSMQAVLVYP